MIEWAKKIYNEKLLDDLSNHDAAYKDAKDGVINKFESTDF